MDREIMDPAEVMKLLTAWLINNKAKVRAYPGYGISDGGEAGKSCRLEHPQLMWLDFMGDHPETMRFLRNLKPDQRARMSVEFWTMYDAVMGRDEGDNSA